MLEAQAAAGRVCIEVAISRAWVDEAGRLRPAFYTAAFDGSIDHLKDVFGLDAAWRERHRRSTVALEARLTVLGPAWQDETLQIESRIVDFDAKRLHIAQVLARGAWLRPPAGLLALVAWIAAAPGREIAWAGRRYRMDRTGRVTGLRPD
jgi:acyl-CoA thioesterase FadM